MYEIFSKRLDTTERLKLNLTSYGEVGCLVKQLEKHDY